LFLKPESELSSAKRALIEQWRRGQPANNSEGSVRGIPRRPDPASAPLSFGQRQLWFFNQIKPKSALYNIPIPLRLLGNLNTDALQSAFDTIVCRHEILRSHFLGDPNPVQLLAPPTAVKMHVLDLRELPAVAREAEAKRLVEDEVQRPFNLEKDLMIRSLLLRTGDQEWILVIVMHHLASDIWSWRVVCRELKELYEASLLQRPVSLPNLPIQYADFAAWQQKFFSPKNIETHLAYWRQKLARAPGVLNLPFDHARPPVQTFEGASEYFTLPAGLSAQLDDLSKREGVTLYMTLLAAFQTLLHRYTGEEDVLVGSPTAGRTRVEFERLIGNFVNTLVLRTSLQGDPVFRELVHRVRNGVIEALAHQDVSFDHLVKELRPERSASYLPLVQVMFALQDELARNFLLPDVQTTPIRAETGTAKFDLTLTILESEGPLKCWVEYNSNLFEQPTILRMLGHYQQLLQAIVANPNQRISELPLLTAEERQQLLSAWNGTNAEYPRDKCVHELFLDIVKKQPEAIAAVFGDELLTYDQLNRRSNQLARHLQTKGVEPETLVGICLDRSAEMVVALLAILKTGAAYVPLEPSRALERIRLIAGDAKMRALVTQQRWLEILELDTVSPVCLDKDREQISREQEDNLDSNGTSESLAYVIYTSGSTGIPKGVQIPHRAVVNFLESMRRQPGLTDQDVVVSITSLSFDICGLEIFLPLSVGARVVLADEETIRDGFRMADLIEKSGATVMQATPATWNLLLETGWRGNKRLRMLCGGESLSRQMADRLLERGAALWNLYGPTETTIWSTLSKVGPSPEPITIGKPIANTQVYVLDDRLRPVPVGIAGELHIGGDGLARGYLNRPELTREKFIPNPFDPQPGARVYRTGDRVRCLSDGNLQFLGRLDHQVKIRGHRIELGEIETILATHPAIQRAVVSLREDSKGSPQLVAYFVPEPRAVAVNHLRSFLEQKLPDYAIPSVFVPLETFPLTISGKIDRRALPAPAASRTSLPEQMVAPASKIEEKLALIWCEVLELPKVGINDNFFELGGHSLRLTQVISRIRNVFQIELPFSQVFQTPTIAQLSVLLEERAANGVKDPITTDSKSRIIKRRRT